MIKLQHQLKIIALFIFVNVILLYFYQHSFRQDLISYLSISEKYYTGDFYNALNGVWGPLISWLILPFLFLGLTPILSFKILQILIGAATLYGTMLLMNRQENTKTFQYHFAFAAILIISFYVNLTGTPDLLFACLLLYIIITLKEFATGKSYIGLITGLLGALLYLSKPFGLPIFIFTIILILLCHKWIFGNSNYRLIVHQLLLSLFVFTILISPWVYLLTSKYGKLTFSTGGEYNFAISGPLYQGIHSIRINRLYEPVNRTATSYWEDPSFLQLNSWNPFESIDNFSYLAKNILKNFIQVIVLIFYFSPFLFFIIFLKTVRIFIKEHIFKINLIIGFISIAGLLPLFIQQRFLIIVQIITLFFTYVLTAKFFERFKFNSSFQRTALVIIVLSISAFPIYSLIKYLNDGKAIYNIAEELEKYQFEGRNVASGSNNPLDLDWGNSLTICYLRKAKYFGEIDLDKDSEIYETLKNNNIQYFIVWGKNFQPDNSKFLKVYNSSVDINSPIIKREKSKEFSVFKVL